MKWFKYRHRFSHGGHGWTWLSVADATTDGEARDLVEELTREYEYSEHYRGMDYEIVSKAPRWVIRDKLKDAFSRAAVARRDALLYRNLLGMALDCIQCRDEAVPTNEERADHHVDKRPCPSCGRAVVCARVKFWLLPNDREAMKLLGALVEGGKRTKRGVKWPLQKNEEPVFSRLVGLGLAGGSSYRNIHEIEATPFGVAEWTKHKKARHRGRRVTHKKRRQGHRA